MSRNSTIVSRKKFNYTESLGPISDLETYVKSDWWKHLFNAYYLKTDGDVVNDHSITEKETSLFLDLIGPSENSFILDLCCGHGRHSLELSRRGFKNVFGLDRSHYLISKAKTAAKKENLAVTFREGDARKISFSENYFDFVLIPGNSFGYFETIDEDIAVLSEIRKVLKPDGKILIDITDGDYMKNNFDQRSWEWIDKNFFVCRERSLSKDSERLVSREVITHVTKGVLADQFYAERLYSRQAMIDLLMSNGFKDIKYADLSTESERNMDLGMMGQRLVFTATIEKVLSQRIRKPVKTKILVLMGDPSIPDIVKPDSKFDEDDYYTIKELKKALSSVKEYNFRFLDHHDKLIDELNSLRKKYNYVFNLCDEGFSNDPTKELHIPSLLEIFNYNYSGGTPQCLAYCYDKSLVRGIAKEIDIPVPEAFVIKPDDISFIELNLSMPVIVKPNCGDSSFGITKESVCFTIEELERAVHTIRSKFGYDKPILVEEYLTGKDLSVGIIGNPPKNFEVLPIIEEDYSSLPPELPQICGYEAKWDPESPYWKIKSVRAELSPEVENYLSASCIRLFERLECRDYARFDWRVDKNGTPRLLEVNPNPGWCWDGHLAKMAEIKGISYSALLQKILTSFLNRYNGYNFD